MSDILVDVLSAALFNAAKTTTLKARTMTEATKTASALIAAMPTGTAPSLRSGLLLGEAKKSLETSDPEHYVDQPWNAKVVSDTETLEGTGATPSAALSALLTDMGVR